jgi:hypothetical protein
MGAFVVRGVDGRVVLACWGGEAADEAAAWRDAGYSVTEIDDALVDPVVPTLRSA